jgi:hypothetical protein
VFRNGGNKSAASYTLIEEPDTAPVPKLAPPITIMANPTRAAGGSSQPSAPSDKPASADMGAAAASPPTSQALSALAPRVVDAAEARAPAPQPNIPARENQKVAAPVGGAVAGNISMPSGYAREAAPKPQTLAPIQLRGSSALDAAGERLSLKQVGTSRIPGATVTLYEVAPGDTVTFTEPVSVQLESVVATGLSSAGARATQSRGKAVASPTKRADAAAVSAPDSQRPTAAVGALAGAASAPVPATQVEVANGVTTISWADAATGNMLKLSGRMPEARLQQIKIRIERERVAAAAKKKP